MSKYRHVGAIWLVINAVIGVSILIGVAAAGPAAQSEESAGQAAADATKPTACKRTILPHCRGRRPHRRRTRRPQRPRRHRILVQFETCRSDQASRSVDAGFENTVLLVTATAPWRGLMERARHANAMHANLFIAVHHDSVPDQLIETWQYEGQENHFSDRFSGYSIFVSNDNADRSGSLAFGHLLGKNLQARGLQYTPHYTLPLMGRYRHQLLDADAGVYRYDQLLVLRHTAMPAVLLEAGSIVNRKEELELATDDRRALTANAVTAAVADFCGMRAHPSGEPPLKRALSAKPMTAGRGGPAGLAR